MANFNTKAREAQPNATSYEDGKVYNKNVVEDWINFLFASFLEDRCYEAGSQQMKRYLELTSDVAEELGNEFIAKASMFARNELGMRSIAQLTAAYLNNKQFADKRSYFRNFCHRPDDIPEVFAAIDTLNEKRSHAMVRGFGDYLSGLNSYQLMKYELLDRKYKMYDCINICHPTSPVIAAYKEGRLEEADTWENKIRKGNKSTEEKEQEWKRFVEENRLGYLALIRNLRNILNVEGLTQEWIDTYLIPLLTNEEAIRKSMVFPYQIYCAYKNLDVRNWQVVGALDKAFRTAIGNMPNLPGKTVIMLDVSGSMEDRMSKHSDMTIKEVGAVYAAALYVGSPNSEFIKFGSRAAFASYNRLTNVFDIIREMQENDNCGYGTNIATAFKILEMDCERIFLISDMQTISTRSCGYYDNDRKSSYDIYRNYCNHYGKAKLYSFDLGNYKTQVANPNDPNVFLLTALNDKIFDFIELAEKSVNLVDYINENYSYV